MATARLSFGFIFVIFSVASTSGFPFIPQGADFHEWCQRTTNGSDCTAIIKGDTRDNLKTSANGFCTILNDEAKKFAAGIALKITDLLNSRGWIQTPAARQVLNTCSDTYSRIIYGLNWQDYTELNERTYRELNIGLAKVYDQASYCESSFKPPNKSPISVENQVFMSIVETAAEILNLNQCNQTSACVGKTSDTNEQ